jgi:Fur family ferric uptake transcriptional regulator
MKDANYINDFYKIFRSKGLKLTEQRRVILEEFLRQKGHMNTDEFYRSVKKRMKTVGYATVYRTLKLLKDSGFAREIDVGDGAKRFESKIFDSKHHDHIYCISCGKIEEFSEEQIEKLQEKIAKKMGYRIINHTLQLFGYCEKCSGKVKNNA